jgi:hypothetical protein
MHSRPIQSQTTVQYTQIDASFPLFVSYVVRIRVIVIVISSQYSYIIRIRFDIFLSIVNLPMGTDSRASHAVHPEEGRESHRSTPRACSSEPTQTLEGKTDVCSHFTSERMNWWGSTIVIKAIGVLLHPYSSRLDICIIRVVWLLCVIASLTQRREISMVCGGLAQYYSLRVRDECIECRSTYDRNMLARVLVHWQYKSLK